MLNSKHYFSQVLLSSTNINSSSNEIVILWEVKTNLIYHLGGGDNIYWMVMALEVIKMPPTSSELVLEVFTYHWCYLWKNVAEFISCYTFVFFSQSETLNYKLVPQIYTTSSSLMHPSWLISLFLSLVFLLVPFFLKKATLNLQMFPIWKFLYFIGQ